MISSQAHWRARCLVYPAVIVAQLLWTAPSASAAPPTAAEAAAFIDAAEARLLDLSVKAGRALWVQSTYITDDTEMLAAEANQALIDATVELAAGATRFSGMKLPYDVERRLTLLRTSQSLAAPRDPAQSKELAEIASRMEAIYGKGQYCRPGGECFDVGKITRKLVESRDPAELKEMWEGWHAIAPPIRPLYERFARLGNAGARELGFADMGTMWRSGYDMAPEAFAAELDRLWAQVRPLYEALHTHVRARLAQKYGPGVVKPDAPIPAHLLGNIWSQSWTNIYDLVAPPGGDPGYDLTALLRKRNLDAPEMVRFGERFFLSLGFTPLPDTFWRRSMLTQPRDRDVVCHASAWNVNQDDDLRIKMCIEINEEDFVTIHHELGHNYYYRAYGKLPHLYRNGANDGFHEGIGDTLALSITPEYLVKIGLLDKAPGAEGDLGLLMKMALDKVAFLPFGLVIDSWRWKVFSGEVPPARYNQAWWELRTKYQGIAPPAARSEKDFDPGAKYHVPGNTPYMRYFLADILQFQFHRALCRAAGYTGPLHRCSIYDNKAAGERLIKMMQMGSSRPWPDALEAISGQREMDASAMVEYFAPLTAWLEEQNRGRPAGW
jgi:peptidyl-dipeptidase A